MLAEQTDAIVRHTSPGLTSASTQRRRTLPASDPLLAGDQLVRLTEEDLRRQVPAQLPAERAGNFY
jgi:hypothetical protein